MRRKIIIVLAILITVFLIIQVVPYGRTHKNPPVLQEPNWDSSKTRTIVQNSCFACHSNETERPWYGTVAPISWLIQNDIEEGRRHLNFSEWGLGDRHENEGDLREVIESKKMALPRYLMMHPEANLTDLEREKLIEGLAMTLELTDYSNGNDEYDHEYDDEVDGHNDEIDEHNDEADAHGHDD